MTDTTMNSDGKLIVITAPLTEAIDHAGYFIQMALASLPIWMEWVLNKKYPHWREVEHEVLGRLGGVDASFRAGAAPFGVAVLENGATTRLRLEPAVGDRHRRRRPP